ncbi:hypothetical protein AOA12_12810 [Microbacterium sp. No. 7]|nr:hypothetical protein AOA12_12810 [Microbacterium sp. No. 7]
MTAWRQDAYGGPDIVRRVDAETPRPRRGEVLVRVGAAALNSADVRILRGEPLILRLAFGLRRPRTPVPGRDVAGTVVALGDGVTGLAVGDRVAGEVSGGGLATFLAAPASRLVPVPDAVDDRTAAALPLAGGTAWQALDLARVTAGARLLVLGAGGGVGTFVVRLAVLRGAEVHALCSARAADAVAALGAARVDPRDLDLAGLPAGGYDAVIVLGGATPLRSLLRLVRDGGCVVDVGGDGGRIIGPLGRMLHGAILSVGARRRARVLAAVARTPITAELLALAASGDLVPVIDRVHPLADARAALARLDEGGAVGKVLVEP